VLHAENVSASLLVLDTCTVLGEAFDLRDFHHVLLHLGFAPLSVMEEEIDNYIRALKAKATSGKHDLTLVVLLVTVACVVASA